MIFASSGMFAWLMAADFLVAGVLCAAVLFMLLRTGKAMRLASDIPNHRSLHVTPVPRVGGWGIVPVSVVLMSLASAKLWPVAAGALALAAVSYFDDRFNLSARLRFLVHFLIASALLAFFPLPQTIWWCGIGLIFGLVWLINLYNFMDGVDGLAGGMAVFGFLGYALGASPGAPAMALTAIAVAGAAAGFLIFNFHPARMFLGDVGSIPLGFLAGAIGYLGWREQLWGAWFPPMLFAPFIADASVTLARRLARGEKFWHAHREHYYQRMVQMGLGHARTALSWYALMALGVGLSLFALHMSALGIVSVIGGWCLVLVVCGWRIDRSWTRLNQTKASL